MDRKTVIAFVIIGLIFILWPIYQKKIVGVPDQAQQIEKTLPVEIEKSGDEKLSSDLKVYKSDAVPYTSTVQQKKPVSGVDEKIYSIETKLYSGEVSNVGGGTIVSWKLKDYLDPDGQPVQLIQDDADGNLGVSLGIAGGGVDLSSVTFHTVADTQWTGDQGAVHQLLFAYDVEGQGVVEKELTFTEGKYDFHLITRFKGVQSVFDGYNLFWESGLAPTEKEVKYDQTYCQAFALQGKELLKTKEKGTDLCEGNTKWAAVRTKYFAMILMPEKEADAAELEGKKAKVVAYDGTEADWKILSARLAFPFHDIENGESRVTVFLGPMDYPLMKSYNLNLQKTMNLGISIIRPFSIAFYYTLIFLYGLVGNYGWAIIIFSIMIKIILYPLTRKSFQSMKEMQALQPKISELREKFSKDPQRLNQETMKLYKDHGVNPMGGCLPMALQMPVLFALFNLFRTTIMMRQAEFLMISDLSAPDGALVIGGMAINVLPILMTVTSLIQQKMTTTDPKQKAMTMFMPLFLAFIFYRLSAALNLYYFMFNVLTIAQEMIVKKRK